MFLLYEVEVYVVHILQLGKRHDNIRAIGCGVHPNFVIVCHPTATCRGNGYLLFCSLLRSFPISRHGRSRMCPPVVITIDLSCLSPSLIRKSSTSELLDVAFTRMQ
jgi:hypothetical protein